MKLCRFDGGRYGVVRDAQVYDVSAHVAALFARTAPVKGDPFIANLEAIVAQLETADLGAPAVAVAVASFESPVRTPTKIIGAPVNYEAHIAESAADPAISYNRAVARIDQAGLFLKATSALVGPSAGVCVRFPDRRTDHEVELGVIIGRECSDIPEDRALEVVAGYAIALDMTVRGTEDRSFRKSIDTYAVLGPWLVTHDEIPDPGNIDFEISVNGVVRQKSNTKHLILNVPTLIAWASRWYALQPGDIIMTGTPEGVGPVGPGDVMHATMERVGDMIVKVRAAAPQSGGSHPAGVAAG